MTGAIGLFLALTMTFGTVVALYGWGVWISFESSAPTRTRSPALALVPVLTPWAMWRAGAKRASLLLVGASVLYAALAVAAVSN